MLTGYSHVYSHVCLSLERRCDCGAEAARHGRIARAGGQNSRPPGRLLHAEICENILSGLKGAVAVATRGPHAGVAEAHDVRMSAAGQDRQKPGMQGNLPSLLHAEICENILTSSRCRFLI